MKGSVCQTAVDGRRTDLYLPPKGLITPDCLTAFVGDAGALFELLPNVMPALEERMEQSGRGLVIVGMYPGDRDADYTPWPAKGFDENYPDFPGRAGDYIRWIDERLLPELSARCTIADAPERRCIAGYSLSGLLATYLPFISPNFGWSASISGSNWYEGFADYLSAHQPRTDCRFFLSYGRAEGAGKYSMHRDAGECAQAAAAALSRSCGGDHVQLVSDNGKHHNKRTARFTTALSWFLLQGKLPE